MSDEAIPPSVDADFTTRITIHLQLDDTRYEVLEGELAKAREHQLHFTDVILDKVCTEYVNSKVRKANRGTIMGVWDQLRGIGEIDL